MRIHLPSALVVAGLIAAGCATPNLPQSESPPPPATGHQPPAVADNRTPLPLLPRMARHQLENMRDHLAAIQEITAATAANDFAAVERASSRIGSSEEMGQMCEHMGRGAPGFTALALNFHRTADGITRAAKSRDPQAVLKSVAATLQTCVGCHAAYRQEIVDETRWRDLLRSR